MKPKTRTIKAWAALNSRGTLAVFDYRLPIVWSRHGIEPMKERIGGDKEKTRIVRVEVKYTV